MTIHINEAGCKAARHPADPSVSLRVLGVLRGSIPVFSPEELAFTTRRGEQKGRWERPHIQP
jgi:hypothetical protein